MKRRIALAVLALLFLAPIVAAAEGDIDMIMEPVNKIYDLVKGVISVAAILAITFAGAKFMFSGDNIQAREGAKSMISYAVVGLVVVWIAPILVGYLTSPMV